MRKTLTIPTLMLLLTLVSFSVHPYGVSREAQAQEIPSVTVTISAVDGNNAPIPNGGTTSSNVIKFTITPLLHPPPGGTPLPRAHYFDCFLDGNDCNIGSENFNPVFSGLAPGQHELKVAVSGTAPTGPITSGQFAFSWTITPPSLTPIQATQQLIQLKQSMHLAAGIDRELDAQLNAVILLFQHNLKAEACGHLGAFTIVVQSFSQSGLLTETQASQLLQGAQSVEKIAGC